MTTTSSNDTINKDSDEESTIFGYKRNYVKTVFTYIGYACSAFLLRLLYFWLPHWHLKSTHSLCSLQDADKILVRDQYLQLFVENVRIVSQTGLKLDRKSANSRQSINTIGNSATTLYNYGPSPGAPENSAIRYFVHKKIRYIWRAEAGRFVRNEVFDNTPCVYFHETPGLDEESAALERVKFGVNLVSIPLTPIWKLLVFEGLHPFYIFQVYSAAVWFAGQYIIYAVIIVVMSIVSLSVTTFVSAKNERSLRKTLVGSSIVSVYRSSKGGVESIDSTLLVPGDIINIPQSGCTMQCDAVLVSGTCIVNEGMLTGESVPLLKTPLPSTDARFSLKDHAKHVLFCGTRVIQTRHAQDVRAVVVRTGFATSKGDLVRSILFPKPNVFTFNRDVINYLEVLTLLALAGLIYTVVLMKIRGDEWNKIVIRSLDIVTIAVPPSLPVAMTIGIIFAQARLRKRQIFCIAPKTINVSGAVNLLCFDKTGTLTESGLDLWGVLQIKDMKFLDVTPKPSSLPEPSQLLEAMATCHALTRIESVLSGDPLDLKMFESTEWRLDEPDTIDYGKTDKLVNLVASSPASFGAKIGVVRQFTFSSDLQRMSVIAASLDSDGIVRADQPLVAYMKGSPEMVHTLCQPQSIPSDFHDQLMKYTSHGYRVIGLASRQLPLDITMETAQKVNRDEVEREFRFLGLLVMENRLKPETVGTIDTLVKAGIRPVMVTGDNILTALSVARESKIIGESEVAVIVLATDSGSEGPNVEFAVYGDPRRKVTDAAVLSPSSTYRLAISGPSWHVVKSHFPQLVPRLAVAGGVFARFSPVQKVQLVESLQELGYTVGMCGDGANDCGALKAAHTGISLSEAEASVASPFTSKEQNISCVLRLIQEGRCALVTSFGIIKFMVCYSMTQFVSVLILYWIGTNLTNNQFVYIDLFLITSHFFTYSYTEPLDVIYKEPPSHRLMSFVTLTSMLLQCLIVIGFQVLAFFYVQLQPWFYAFVPSSSNMACYENSAIFLISLHQYIALAIVFSKSAPYRKLIITNYAFLINIAVTVGVNLYVFFAPNHWLGVLLEIWNAPLDNPSLTLKFLLVGASLGHFLLALVVELVVESIWFSRLVRRVSRRLLAKPKTFERVAKELKLERGKWPPISDRFQRAKPSELLSFVSGGGGGDGAVSTNPGLAEANARPPGVAGGQTSPGKRPESGLEPRKSYYTAL